MFFFRTILFITILVCFSIVSFGQNIDVEIEKLLVIGNDENASEEYLFYFPQHICTDQENNIYISDRNMCRIKVFDQNGKYIQSIGHRGQGPGEIQEITCFTVARNNDIIVVDKMNMRFTRFINMGDSSVCYPFLNQTYIDPWEIRPFGQDSFIIRYTDRTISEFRKKPFANGDQILHIYNHDFSRIIESVVDAKEIWNLEDPFLVTEPRSYNSVKINIFQSKKIIISPSFYSGIFYIFEKVNKQWHKKTLRGIQIKGKPYELYAKKPQKIINFQNAPVGYFSKSGQGYHFRGRKLNTSRGVFFTKKNIIMNITGRLDKKLKKYRIGIEFFNQEGKYLGYGRLSDKKNKYDHLLRKLIICWKDKNDRFYTTSENEEGFRVVRVLKFKYDLGQ